MTDDCCATPNELAAQKATLTAVPQSPNTSTSHVKEEYTPLGDKAMTGGNIQ